MISKEFKVNEYITLKLQRNKTFIYVNGKKFLQCIRLTLDIPRDDIELYDEIQSIDEAAGLYKRYLYQNRIMNGDAIDSLSTQKHNITPEQEFWGHCSNIHAWVDQGYDTRILNSNLSFPLLEELVEVGDPLAKKVFKEEIAMRLDSGYPPTILFLLENHYLEYLNRDELFAIFENFNFSNLKKHVFNIVFPLLKELNKLGIEGAETHFKEEIYNLIIERNLVHIPAYFYNNYFDILVKQDFSNFSQYFISKIGQFSGQKVYFEIMESFFQELHRRDFFSENNPIIEEILQNFFSQILKEKDQEWSDLLFLLLDNFSDLALYPQFLEELLAVFEKLDNFSKADLFINVFKRDDISRIMHKQFGILLQMLRQILTDITKIETQYDQGYVLADLLLVLNQTPFLEEVTDVLQEKLSIIIDSLNPESEYATKKVLEEILESIFKLDNSIIRIILTETIQETTNYILYKNKIHKSHFLGFDVNAIKTLMRDNGARFIEREAVYSLIGYLHDLATKIIKKAYIITRHQARKKISFKFISQAINLHLEDCKHNKVTNLDRIETIYCKRCNSHDIEILLRDPAIFKCLNCNKIWGIMAKIVGNHI